MRDALPATLRHLLGRFRRAVRQLVAPSVPTSGVHEAKLDGVRFALDLSQSTHRHIYRRRHFEPDLVNALRGSVRPGDVVLDIGANFGFHSVQLAVRRPDLRAVYAFEPGRAAFALLLRNLELNEVPIVTARRHAVGRRNESATLKQFDSLGTVHASLYPLADVGFEEEPVEVRPLDEVVAEMPAVPAVIKCDVEGGEMDVLLGAGNLLGGGLAPPPIWFLEANYETAAMSGFFPWDLIDEARRHAPYRGFHLRDGGVREMPHPRALRHGDTLVLAIPEEHRTRLGAS